MKKGILTLTIILATAMLMAIFSGPAMAKVTGRCDNCHTMHNSQNGASLDDGGPYETLLKGGCIGCHSHATETQTYSLGTSTVPVVNHTGGVPATYLAGGNFYWVLNGDDAKGHNVYGLANQDAAITTTEGAPGDVNGSCGATSCHVTLAAETTSLGGPGGCQGCHLNVMHHADDGTGTKYVDTAAKGWYRFLSGHMTGGDDPGVAGIEHSGWGPSNGTVGGTDHNEYLGVPVVKTGSTTLANKSMTAFCCGCHGNFHVEQDSSGNWIRHPSDAVIPDTLGSEYASMSNSYNPEVPVARPAGFAGWVTGSPSAVATAGTDMVMCLSCHRPHGSPNDDMLRWDYADMIAGDPLKSGGCFACHTEKND